jgi:hypothetical protein
MYSRFINRWTTCMPFLRVVWVPDERGSIATREPLGLYPTKLHSKADTAPEALHVDPVVEATSRTMEVAMRIDTTTHSSAETLHDPLERVGQPPDDSPVAYLDLDVIDASTLDSNVHGLRHAYFNLNSFIVDDLVEIVTTRRRACMRRRLIHSVGNVWCFLAAPAHVDEV